MDITDNVSFSRRNDSVWVRSLPCINETYYFQMEVLDGEMQGGCNVFRFYYSSEDPNYDDGGDLDGGDQGDQGELPPANPPTDPPEGQLAGGSDLSASPLATEDSDPAGSAGVQDGNYSSVLPMSVVPQIPAQSAIVQILPEEAPVPLSTVLDTPNNPKPNAMASGGNQATAGSTTPAQLAEDSLQGTSRDVLTSQPALPSNANSDTSPQGASPVIAANAPVIEPLPPEPTIRRCHGFCYAAAFRHWERPAWQPHR